MKPMRIADCGGRVRCHLSGVTCQVSGVRCHASRITHHASRISSVAFTLIELLVVISIMGLLAAIAMPAFNKLKPNVMAAATQKLLTDVGRARQLAIADHTTVFMIFVPPSFWTSDAGAWGVITSDAPELLKAQKLYDKQMVGYNFVSLRSVGDQPGRNTVRYLDSWRTLPDGVYIPYQKFFYVTPWNFYTNTTTGPVPAWFSPVPPFLTANSIPFPSETTPSSGGHWLPLPYIAFNYLGQLVNASGQPTGQNAFIPLAQGSVLFSRDVHKMAVQGMPGYQETPPGNTTNAYNVINIDWLTGRARVERQELQ